MYIYKISVLVKWSYSTVIDTLDMNDPETYNVAAKNFTQALAKVEKLVTSSSKKWKDIDDETGKEITHYPEFIVDVVKVERGAELDG